MARRNGSTWFIAGINGTDVEKTLTFQTDKLKNLGKNVTVFEDGAVSGASWTISKGSNMPTSFVTRPRGGFVIVVK